jgi:hypothetical protein
MLEALHSDPASCLDDHLHLLRQSPSTSNLRVIVAPYSGTRSAEVSVAFSLESDGPDQERRVAYIRCANGNSRVATSALRLVESIDQDRADEVLLRVTPEPDGIWLWGYDPPPSAALGFDADPLLPANGWNEIGITFPGWAVIGDDHGVEAHVTFFGRVDASVPATPQGVQVAMLRIAFFRGTEEWQYPGDVLLDQDRFALLDEEGRLYAAKSSRWTEGPGDLHNPQLLLSPGQSAELEIQYIVPSDQAITTVVCWCAQPFAGSASMGGYTALETGLGPDKRPLAGAIVFPVSDDHDILVAIANIGDQPQVIDPRRLRLSGLPRTTALAPLHTEWTFPATSRSQDSQTLDPGDVAVVRADLGRNALQHGDFVLYIDDVGHLHELDYHDTNVSPGGSLPILIDME